MRAEAYWRDAARIQRRLGATRPWNRRGGISPWRLCGECRPEHNFTSDSWHPELQGKKCLPL